MYVTSASSFLENANIQPINMPIEEMIDNSTIRHFEAGEPLFLEGDDAHLVYQIVEGVVQTSKLLSNGRRQILSFGYPSDLVGLSHDDFYHCDCEAVSDVKLQVIRKNASTFAANEDRALYDGLLKYAAAEVAGMQEHFMTLGCKSATEKIASFLVSLSERVGEQVDHKTCFNLPMRRADIADFLGTTTETVSRNMTKLRIAGIIDLPDPHRVCICKPAALRKLAENEE